MLYCAESPLSPRRTNTTIVIILNNIVNTFVLRKNKKKIKVWSKQTQIYDVRQPVSSCAPRRGGGYLWWRASLLMHCRCTRTLLRSEAERLDNEMKTKSRAEMKNVFKKKTLPSPVLDASVIWKIGVRYGLPVQITTAPVSVSGAWILLRQESYKNGRNNSNKFPFSR